MTLLQYYYHIRHNLLLLSRRLGLSQLEGFRRHLLEVLQKSNKPKVTSRLDTVEDDSQTGL